MVRTNQMDNLENFNECQNKLQIVAINSRLIKNFYLNCKKKAELRKMNIIDFINSSEIKENWRYWLYYYLSFNYLVDYDLKMITVKEKYVLFSSLIKNPKTEKIKVLKPEKVKPKPEKFKVLKPEKIKPKPAKFEKVIKPTKLKKEVIFADFLLETDTKDYEYPSELVRLVKKLTHQADIGKINFYQEIKEKYNNNTILWIYDYLKSLDYCIDHNAQDIILLE